MPRLLAVGHVTWDRAREGDVLGGTVTFAAQTVRRLGWEVAILTSAGPDFEPARDLPGRPRLPHALLRHHALRERVRAGGTRRQVLMARADDIALPPLPEEWRDPDALLLGPVAGELRGFPAPPSRRAAWGRSARAGCARSTPRANVSPQEWTRPRARPAGVHVLFVSQHDLREAPPAPHDFLEQVPIVALTRGWQGVTLCRATAHEEIPGFPRPEVDPTGAGDVFAAAFLVALPRVGRSARRRRCSPSCAASCAVEGVGATSLGDRAEVERRIGAARAAARRRGVG